MRGKIEHFIKMAAILMVVLIVGMGHYGPYHNVADNRSKADAPSKIGAYYKPEKKPPAGLGRIYFYRPVSKTPDYQELKVLINTVDSNTPAIPVATLYAGSYSSIFLKPGAYQVSAQPGDSYSDHNLIADQPVSVTAGKDYFVMITNKLALSRSKIVHTAYVLPIVEQLPDLVS